MARIASEILDELAANAGRPFAEAFALPPAAYHDTEVLGLEIQRLFRRDWLCLGRLAEMPASGDYLARDLAGAPVMAVRQPDGGVRAFANVCRHRGARLLQGEGHVAKISCPYHSWTYDLQGRLVGAPFMHRTAGFDAASVRLPEMRCEIWQGFVYVSLDESATSLAGRLAALERQIGDYRMADYVPVFTSEDTWSTNWKCLVENFMDAYHVHRVHRNSFARYGSSEERTVLLDGDDAFTCHYVDEDSGPKAVAAHPDNDWICDANRHRTWLINVFPAHLMQLQPDMLWYLSIVPCRIDEVRIRWSVSIPAEILAAAADRPGTVDAVVSLIRQVNDEDRPVVESVFQATKSLHAQAGRLSYLERNVWQFGRYLARRLGTG